MQTFRKPSNSNSILVTAMIEELEAKLRVAKKILDKGGCVVVEGNEDAVITAYNYKLKH
jgi:hypothetical protein